MELIAIVIGTTTCSVSFPRGKPGFLVGDLPPLNLLLLITVKHEESNAQYPFSFFSIVHTKPKILPHSKYRNSRVQKFMD